jgi:hypothetical protein
MTWMSVDKETEREGMYSECSYSPQHSSAHCKICALSQIPPRRSFQYGEYMSPVLEICSLHPTGISILCAAFIIGSRWALSAAIRIKEPVLKIRS